ncbi:hypothetical protein A9Q82_08240 [Cycloclasticus sp. 46_120_T64]|nr:hypothetical protein A9Q82_08240 [Cycloclasticus sp. 46_120_T64]
MLNIRNKVAGSLLFASIVLTIILGFDAYFPRWIPGVLAWLSALLLINEASPEQKKISLILMLIGALGWLVAWLDGLAVDWLKIASMNQSLITLLVGVHFLRLVAVPDGHQNEQLPRGKAAFLSTFLGTHILSSVVNMSSVIFVGDRIANNGRVSQHQAALLVRALASAVFWSPFFAGFGAAMVFAENSSLWVLMACGMLTALFSMAFSYAELNKETAKVVDDFTGFPMHFDAFRIPLLLAGCVLLGHYLFPEFKVIVLIPLLACLISLLVLSHRRGVRPALEGFSAHVTTQLPGMRGELMLYLCAGLLGSGLSVLIQTLDISLPISELNGPNSVLVLSCMILASRMGIHPVISIAVVGGWFVSLEPNHTLLATMFLLSWGIGVCINPFSGINLLVFGRYQVKGRDIVRWNTPYALKMFVVAAIILLLQAHWLGL